MSEVTDDDNAAPLYASRKAVYQQSVKGRFRSIKWMLLTGTLAVYYLLPFVRWDRGPNAPDQAVLIDFPNRRFYFFFIEIWPQEIYYLSGLLILAALSLFLMNALAGRIWCGYLCPQTVWTDLFFAVERFWEGDRREHMLADQKPMSLNRLLRRIGKHLTWLMIAWWTGGAWVLYFSDAPTLVYELATFKAPFVAYLWIGILTATTYLLAGWMREQVCIYMCPWPRIQAALTDEDALNVTYKYDRAEPRMSLKEANALRSKGEKAGDCIDCHQCINVCPTGVDIRNGLQLDCIQCGLCIDACDNVMTKIGRPTGLIGYDTDEAIKARMKLETPVYRLIRPRTIVYAAAIAAVSLFMLYSLLGRSELDITAQHDRNPLYVTLSDGSIRNGYTLRLLNKTLQRRTFRVETFGLGGAKIQAADAIQELEGRSMILSVPPDNALEVRTFVAVDKSATKPGTQRVVFRLSDVDTGRSATVRETFVAP
ncbi:MAG: cytochrome c oxidase accessory protein CcoG [Beijerinckiaceae bacterium]